MLDAGMVIPAHEVQAVEKSNFVEEPEAIVDRKVKKLRTKEISLVKVQ